MSEPPRKLRFRPNVRALMVLVVVIAGVLGWKVNRARTQRLAVDAVGDMGGMIVYDYRFPGSKANGGWVGTNQTEPSAPKWLRRQFGDEFFQEVTAVNFGLSPPPKVWPVMSDFDHLVSISFADRVQTTLRGLSGLSWLGRVRIVRVVARKVEPASLAEIATLPNLEELAFMDADLSDADMAILARSPRLASLTIFGARNLNGAAHLARLRSLRDLNLLPIERVTDRLLHDLAPILPNLERFLLWESAMTDAGMAELKAATSLKRLDIHSNEVTDVGLAALSELNKLEELDLVRSGVTDVGLVRLRGLKALKVLDLRGTRVTPEGVDSLKKAIPGLSVRIDPMTRSGSKPVAVPTPR